MNPEIQSSINPAPLTPALDDAPPMVIGPIRPIGPFFYTTDQWKCYTLCFPVQTRIKMQAAWWRLELWSQAVRQNRNAN